MTSLVNQQKQSLSKYGANIIPLKMNTDESLLSKDQYSNNTPSGSSVTQMIHSPKRMFSNSKQTGNPGGGCATVKKQISTPVSIKRQQTQKQQSNQPKKSNHCKLYEVNSLRKDDIPELYLD